MSAVAVFGLLFMASMLLFDPGGADRWRAAGSRRLGVGQRPGTVGLGPGSQASGGPAAKRSAAVPGAAGDAEPANASAGGVDDLPLLLELLGAALDAGLSVPRSLQLVAGICQPRLRTGLDVVVAGLAIGASWQHSWHRVRHQKELTALYRALSFAALTGAPSSSLLYAEADQLRRDAQRAAEQRAGTLGVKLVVPLGLCSLPAFICLGVVPVVVAMLPQF